jgi:hypothetical protein
MRARYERQHVRTPGDGRRIDTERRHALKGSFLEYGMGIGSAKGFPDGTPLQPVGWASCSASRSRRTSVAHTSINMLGRWRTKLWKSRIRRTADNRRGSILLGHSLFALERLFLPRRRRYGVSVQRGS